MITLAYLQQIITENSGHGPDRQAVEQMNAQGIDLMMQTHTESALCSFVDALKLCGSDQNLQAETLGNIGDHQRRVPGNGTLALEIFDFAQMLGMTLINQSRLLSKEAMVYVLPTEVGQGPDPDGVAKCIITLQWAMRQADEAVSAGEDTLEALKAKCFAAHRLTGQACQKYATAEQKMLALNIIRNIYPQISGNPELKGEEARLRYAEAVLTADEDPITAAAKLVVSALQIGNSSPLDLCNFLSLAGEFFHRSGEHDLARACYVEAIAHECQLDQHASRFHVREALNRLKQLLNL